MNSNCKSWLDEFPAGGNVARMKGAVSEQPRNIWLFKSGEMEKGLYYKILILMLPMLPNDLILHKFTRCVSCQVQ